MKSLHERINDTMKVGDYRMVSKVAKSMRATVSEVRDAVEDAENLDLVVGMRCGSGIAEWPQSEYQIEKYDE